MDRFALIKVPPQPAMYIVYDTVLDIEVAVGESEDAAREYIKKRTRVSV